MDLELVRLVLVAVGATVSLGAYMRSGFVRLEAAIVREGERRREDHAKLAEQRRKDFRALSQQQREGVARLEASIVRLAEQQHKEFRALSQQQREGEARLESAIVKVSEKLAETTERTARIEGILARGWVPQFEATAAQAVPEEPPDAR